MALLAVAVGVLLLTSRQMSLLRDASPSLSLLISRLDHMDTPFDMPHVALFTVLGLLLRILLPGLRWWLLLLGIAAMAAATELLQFLTVGRTPRLLDVRDDLVGACVGVLVGSVPVLLARWWTRGRGTLSDAESSKRLEARVRLASLLAGTAPGDMDGRSAPEPEALLAAAHAEGVTALLAERLRDEPWPSRDLQDALTERARDLAKMELGQHAALVAVLARLHAAGIPVLVLKGTALRCWLYPQPYLRESSDIDLLFATREAAMAAVATLQPMGYAAPYPPGRFAHEVLCRHPGKRIDLDLHWGLSRNPAMACLPGFPALLDAAQPLPGLGPSALGLGHVDALLHACVHRASNLEGGLGDRLKWLYDLHLLAGRLDGAGWEAFAAACRSARVCGIAGDGLQASSGLFGTTLSRTAMEALQAGVPNDALDAHRLQDWAYLQWKSLRALPGWATRVAWLHDRAFPQTGYLRELYGRDLSRTELLWCRLRRLLGRLRGVSPSSPG